MTLSPLKRPMPEHDESRSAAGRRCGPGGFRPGAAAQGPGQSMASRPGSGSAGRLATTATVLWSSCSGARRSRRRPRPLRRV